MLLISVTDEVLKPLKSREGKEEHSSNMLLISVTDEVLKPLTSREVKD